MASLLSAFPESSPALISSGGTGCIAAIWNYYTKQDRKGRRRVCPGANDIEPVIDDPGRCAGSDAVAKQACALC